MLTPNVFLLTPQVCVSAWQWSLLCELRHHIQPDRHRHGAAAHPGADGLRPAPLLRQIWGRAHPRQEGGALPTHSVETQCHVQTALCHVHTTLCHVHTQYRRTPHCVTCTLSAEAHRTVSRAHSVQTHTALCHVHTQYRRTPHCHVHTQYRRTPHCVRSTGSCSVSRAAASRYVFAFIQYCVMMQYCCTVTHTALWNVNIQACWCTGLTEFVWLWLD